MKEESEMRREETIRTGRASPDRGRILRRVLVMSAWLLFACAPAESPRPLIFGADPNLSNVPGLVTPTALVGVLLLVIIGRFRRSSQSSYPRLRRGWRLSGLESLIAIALLTYVGSGILSGSSARVATVRGSETVDRTWSSWSSPSSVRMCCHTLRHALAAAGPDD